MSEFGDIMMDKCVNFSLRIINLCKYIRAEKREFRISDQLFRSGTSIGANLSEAQCAISRKDFVSKVYISLKECNETLYWLKLLVMSGTITEKQFQSINDDCEELKRLLTRITISTRKNDQEGDNS